MPNHQLSYRFGGFQLDPARRRLRSPEGHLVRLTPRVFDALLYMVERPGELLDKNSMMQALWPETVVEENNLNQAIAALRRALGEKPGDYRFIITEPGRGYRFVAMVETESGEGATTGEAPTPKAIARHRLVLGSVAVVLLIIAAIGFFGGARDTSAPGASLATESSHSVTSVIPHSVAVLPFDNLSPKPEDAYFATGIHDEIINRLAGIGDLNVIARTSVMQYAGTTKSISEIARQLRVESVLEGTVRYAGGQVRLTTQLIDADSGTELWSGAYSRDLTDIFNVQGEIASAIALALQAELLPSERARLEKPPTDSPAAFALYLQAMKQLNDVNIQESLALLDRAIAIDPDFAPAYALSGYQRTWNLVNSVLANPNDPVQLKDLERQAISDTDRALELDPDLPVAWVTRAIMNQLTWRWREASAAYGKAYELSPNDIVVLREFAQFKVFIGDDEEGMRLARLQLELDPNDRASHFALSGVAAFSGHLDVALREIERAATLDPSSVMSNAVRGFLLLQLQDFALAEQALRLSEELITDDNGLVMPSMIYGYGRYGYQEEAARLFERLEEWAVDHRVGAGDWALAYLGLRDEEMALEWLTRAVESATNHEADAGFWALVLIMMDIHEDPLLAQPRFRLLRERLREVTQE